MKEVVIFGVGDYARIAAAYLRADSPHTIAAFTADGQYVNQHEFAGSPVVPFETILESHPPDRCALLVAVGFRRVNKARTEVYERCKEMGYEFISYVNSRAFQWGDIQVGDNTFIFEANVLQPFVRIGNNCVLWSGNHIGHDTVIGDNCFIASHVVISGNCRIGNGCFIGVNATFRDGLVIGNDNVIGAGAVIMKNTEAGAVYSVRGTDPHRLKSWELPNF